MSRVAVKGNDSGTGTFTIEAPNSNSNRTLTLPDETGTVLTSGGPITVDADGATVATFDRATSDGTIVDLQKDGSSIGSLGSEGSDLILESTQANHAGLRFAGGSVLPRYNGSLADNAVDLGQVSTNYRFKDLYLSGGVYLGGTGAANYLDDYEEGDWTPTYAGDTTAGTVSSYGARWGRYVKIGNLVHLSFEMGDFDFSGGSGNIKITGIPFSHTTADGQGRVFGGGISLYNHSMSAAGILNLSFRLQSNDDLQIIGTRDNAVWDVLNVESPASDLYVAGNITYYSA